MALLCRNGFCIHPQYTNRFVCFSFLVAEQVSSALYRHFRATPSWAAKSKASTTCASRTPRWTTTQSTSARWAPKDFPSPSGPMLGSPSSVSQPRKGFFSSSGTEKIGKKKQDTMRNGNGEKVADEDVV